MRGVSTHRANSSVTGWLARSRRRVASWTRPLAVGAACGALVVAGTLPALGQSAVTLAPPCPGLDLALDRWTRLPEPSGVALTHAASFAQRPCTFVAVAEGGSLVRSDDVGATWGPVTTPSGSAAVNDLVTEEMPPATGFVLQRPLPAAEAPGEPNSGLLVTRDYGHSFQPVDDFNGLEVVAMAAAPSDPEVLYAAAAPAELPAQPVAPLYKSSDFGNNWTPLPGSVAFRPTELAVDAQDPDVVWLGSEAATAAGEPAGLWVSRDGGLTFELVARQTIHDLDTAAIAGGGGRLDAATPAGLLRSRDQGTSVAVLQDGREVAAISHETFVGTILMAVVDGVPGRSSNEGRTFVPAVSGLPSIADCGDLQLQRNHEFPAYFQLSTAGCSARGHYLYRGDGSDLPHVDHEGPGDTLPFAGRRARVEMEILAQVDMPHPGDGTSGSVAFDGETLYYTNNDQPGLIYEMSPTGEDVGFISVVGLDVRSMAYDSSRDALWVVVGAGRGGRAIVYKIDLDTEDISRAFESPMDSDTSISFDPSLGRFRSYQHHGYEVYEIGPRGVIVDRCTVPGFPVDPNVSTNPDRGHPENPAPGFATGTAAGNGNMYLQLEDDRTIYHVSRRCELLTVLEHRRFDESRGGRTGGENDQIACDTTTFGRPAIWIRDASDAVMFAYAVPDGYCPLDSSLRLDPPSINASPGEAIELCAFLHVTGKPGHDGAIDGEEIRFFARDELVGVAATDEHGRACVAGRAPDDPGSVSTIRAAFLGSISYRPSAAEGTLTVEALPEVQVAPPPRPPRPEREEPVPIVPLIPPPPVIQAPPVEPPPGRPPEVTAPQQQPQPNQQAQGQGQAALARQQQEQPQVAYVQALKDQMSEEYALASRTTEDGAGSPDFRALALAASFVSLMFASVSVAVQRVRSQRVRR